MEECIQYKNRRKREDGTIEYFNEMIPCQPINFPNFNELSFDSNEFDRVIWNSYGPPIVNSDTYSPFMFPENYIDRTADHNNFILQEHQKFISRYANFQNNFNNGVLVYHHMGSGKCLKIGTPVILSDGRIEKVENIKVGYKVMGPDSKPRTVVSLGRGRDIMYEITPIKGDSFVCNSEHILSLKCTNFGTYKNTYSANKPYTAAFFNNKTLTMNNKAFATQEEAKEFLKNIPEKNKYCEIEVKDFIQLPKGTRDVLKLYRTGINFPEKKVPFCPYFIGLWLGDGASSRSQITSQDAVIINHIRNFLLNETKDLYLSYGTKYDYRINSTSRQNEFMSILKTLNLINNKHIPDVYKYNSREVRLKMLAGLLDTDGHNNNGYEYDIIQKNKRMADDILYLARSLGFSANMKEKTTTWRYKGEKKQGIAYRINISGASLREIPVLIKRKKIVEERRQKKDPLVTGFSVKQLPEDDYYGFTLLEDPHFLLGDFTVTHNTCSAIVIGEAYHHAMKGHSKVLVLTPAQIMEQFIKEIQGEALSGTQKGCVSGISEPEVSYIPKQNIVIKEPTDMKDPYFSMKLELYTRAMKDYEDTKRAVLSSKWRFYTHDTFRNCINEHSERLRKYGPNDPCEGVYDFIKREKNLLIIVDEVQNIVSEPSIEGTGKTYETFNRLFIETRENNHRIVLLSGTPIRDHPYQLGLIINLLSPRLYFPLNKKDFESTFYKKDPKRSILKYSEINTRNMDLFKWMCKGYISYFKGGNPREFPKKHITYKYHIMNGTQLEEYEKFARFLMDKEREKRAHKEETGDDLDDVSGFLIRGRNICTSATNTILKIDKGTPLDVVYARAYETYSPKIAEVVKMAIERPGKIFIYTEFIQNGTAIFESLFNALGYSVMKKSEDFRTAKLGPGQRVALWTGGKSGAQREVYNKKLLSNFNSNKNKDGSIIKIIIGTKAISEGISFKYVRDVHLVNPWWNDATMQQIIGRAVRFLSHAGEEDPVVNIFKHITILNKFPDKTIKGYDKHGFITADQIMEMRSIQKQNLIRKFELAAKEASVDCVLNKYGNILRLTLITDTKHEIDHTEEISYYLNEATGNLYNMDLYEIEKEMTVLGQFKIFEKTNHLEISENLSGNLVTPDLITLENLNCTSKKLKFNWSDPGLYNMVNYTENVKINGRKLIEMMYETDDEETVRQFLECVERFFEKDPRLAESFKRFIQKKPNEKEENILKLLKKMDLLVSYKTAIRKRKMNMEISDMNELQAIKLYETLMEIEDISNIISDTELLNYMIKE